MPLFYLPNTYYEFIFAAAHDGHLIVWDLDTKKQLFKHRNMIEQQGHGPGNILI